jgi:hypothetical protein
MTAKKVQKPRARGKAAEGASDVLDLVQVRKEQEQAARGLFRLLDMPGLPPFVSEALYTILNHAARVKGADIGSDAADGYSIKAVTDLFAVTSGFQRGLTFEPSPDVAELISRVVKHPDLGAELRRAFGGVVTEELMSGVDTDSPGVIRALLAEYEKKHGIV